MSSDVPLDAAFSANRLSSPDQIPMQPHQPDPAQTFRRQGQLLLLKLFAGSCTVLSFPAFAFAIYTFAEGRANYGPGVIAATLIGLLLLTASALAIKQSRQPTNIPLPATSNWPLRLAAIPFALLIFLPGLHSLWSAAVLLNQDYLHWFSTTSSLSYGDQSASVALGNALGGAIATYIGLFLASFALFGRRRGKEQSPSLTPDDSPPRSNAVAAPRGSSHPDPQPASHPDSDATSSHGT